MNCLKCNNLCKLFSMDQKFYSFIIDKISFLYREDINFCKECKLCYQEDCNYFVYFKLNNKHNPVYSIVYYIKDFNIYYHCFDSYKSSIIGNIKDLKFDEVFALSERYLDNIMFL